VKPWRAAGCARAAMRRAIEYAVVAAAVAALGIGATVLAYADWTVPVRLVATEARAATMPRGVPPKVAKLGSLAVVSWSAQDLAPGLPMDHYLVTAHSMDSPSLPDIARDCVATGARTQSVTFSGAELAGGLWYWTIGPEFRLWRGAGSGRSRRLAFRAEPAAESVAVVAAPMPESAPTPDRAVPAPAPSPSNSPSPSAAPSASASPNQSGSAPAEWQTRMD
jgi:hypothetical protein